jgi:hypothetical protein
MLPAEVYMNVKNGIVAAAIALLVVVGAIAWTRERTPQVSNISLPYAQPADYAAGQENYLGNALSVYTED